MKQVQSNIAEIQIEKENGETKSYRHITELHCNGVCNSIVGYSDDQEVIRLILRK